MGKIAEVFERFSLVLAATDSKSAIAATTLQSPDIQAVAQGSKGLGISLELIAQDAALAVGDVAVTSLLEENMPAGLFIGAVAGVEYAEGELFKRAELAPFMALGALGRVVVFVPLLRGEAQKEF